MTPSPENVYWSVEQCGWVPSPPRQAELPTQRPAAERGVPAEPAAVHLDLADVALGVPV